MRIRVVDAFTDQPFTGNPAAVCLLDRDDWPDEKWMQQVAAEMNLSETAFAHPLPATASTTATADWALRWFTPAVEVDLCGHATLATAHALHEDSGVAGTVRFASRSGVLAATTYDDGTVTLDFPAAPTTEITIPDGIPEALGAEPHSEPGAEPGSEAGIKEAHGTGALRDLLVVLPDESAVRALSPDLAALAELCRRDDVRAVVATAPAGPRDGYDFVSRVFGPAVGIPEDPVTGSSHTALAPFWSGRLGRDELTGLQASARTGVVRTALRGDRVHLTGRAVTVLDAHLVAGLGS